MATLYVEQYIGPRNLYPTRAKPTINRGDQVFWFGFGRWWSGTTTGIVTDNGEAGHYTQVRLDVDCSEWTKNDDKTLGHVLTSILNIEAWRQSPSVGYFDDAKQISPKHDPRLSAPCPLCHVPLSKDDVRTVSVMADKTVDGDDIPRVRSYFYRLHRTCAERSTEAQRQAMDEYAMAWLPPGLAN